MPPGYRLVRMDSVDSTNAEAKRRADMGEEQRRLDVRRQVMKVGVVPGGLDIPVDTRRLPLAVPADAEAVAVRGRRPGMGFEALVDERMLGLQDQLLEVEGGSRVG